MTQAGPKANTASPPQGELPEITGGPFCVIYGAEELIERSPAGLDPVAFATPVTGKLGLAYRTFWTWDH